MIVSREDPGLRGGGRVQSRAFSSRLVHRATHGHATHSTHGTGHGAREARVPRGTDAENKSFSIDTIKRILRAISFAKVVYFII